MVAESTKGCLAVAALSVLALSGCVSEVPPTIAHTHIGHSVTGWHDTPDQQGLLTTAAREAAIGHEESGLAMKAAGRPDQLREHVRHVLHVYDPERSSPGPGLNYGLCQALTGGVDHIAFAADSADATANVRSSVAEMVENAAPLQDKCALITQLAEEIRVMTSDADALVLTEELHSLTGEMITGVDLDGNGVIGDTPEEYGIETIRRDIDLMTAHENPAYAPVATRWLFNLIRLPDGTWTFKRPRAFDRGDGGGGSGGGY